MQRLKTFLIYAILILVLWIFSDIVIFVGLNSTYQNKTFNLSSPQEDYEINISECKATYVNGYVKGIIKKSPSSGQDIELYTVTKYFAKSI